MIERILPRGEGSERRHGEEVMIRPVCTGFCGLQRFGRTGSLVPLILGLVIGVGPSLGMAQEDADPDSSPSAPSSTESPSEPAKPAEPPVEVAEPTTPAPPSPDPAAPTETPPDPPPPPPSSAAEGDASPPAHSMSVGTASEHVIYVPFQRLKEVFENSAGSIILSATEYRGLLDRLRALERSQPPTEVMLARIDYEGVIGETLATVEARLTVDVIRPGWSRLKLRFNGTTVRSVEGAIATVDEAGQLTLHFDQPGRREVRINLDVPVLPTSEGATFRLDGPRAGTSAVGLILPAGDWEVQADVAKPASGAEAGAKPETDTIPTRSKSVAEGPHAGQPRIDFALGGAPGFQLRWRAKPEVREVETALLASTATQFLLADGVVQTTCQFDIQVLRGEAKEIRLEVASEDKVLDLRGPAVRDWQVEMGAMGEGAAPQVVARLFQPIKDRTQLTLVLERPIPESAFPLSVPKVVGAGRQWGALAVGGRGEIGVAVVERSAITRVSTSEVPKELVREGALYFKHYSPEFQLTIRAERIQPKLDVTQEARFQFEEERISGHAVFSIKVLRAGVFTYRIQLAPGVVFDGLDMNLSAPSLRAEIMEQDEGPMLVVSLPEMERNGGVVAFRFHQPRAADASLAAIALPIPHFLDAEVERGLLAWIVPSQFDVALDVEKSKGVRTASGSGFQFSPLQVPSSSELAALLEYFGSPVEAWFALQRRAPRLDAYVLTEVDVQETSVRTTAKVEYTVRFAPTDRVRLAVPARVADAVEFLGAAIQERRREPPTEGEDEGWVSWTIVFQSLDRDKKSFEVVIQESLALAVEEKTGKREGTVAVPILRPLDVEQSTGEVAIRNQRTLLVETGEVEGAEPIDPRQFPSGVEAAELAFRYFRQPVAITARVTKHEIQSVVQTVAAQTLVDAVVPEDGPIAYRARFRIKTSERQRLLVRMPPGSRFLGVLVAGRTVQPEKGDRADEYLINVTRSSGTDEEFSLMMIYEADSSRGPLSEGRWMVLRPEELVLAMPTFAGDATMLRVLWRVWLPRGFALWNEPAGFVDMNNPWVTLLAGAWFVPAEPALVREVEGRVAETGQGGFEFPLVGRPFVYRSEAQRSILPLQPVSVGPAAVVATLFVLLVFIYGLRLSLERKLSLVLLLLVVIVLASYLAPTPTARWLGASRGGFALGGVLWLIQGIVVLRRLAVDAPVAGDGEGSEAKGEDAGEASESFSTEPASPSTDEGEKKPGNAEGEA